jgi:hypothetical protein
MHTTQAGLGLMLAIVCGCGGPVADDGGTQQQEDAGPDAGAPVQTCEAASYGPEIGVDRFCPSVHEYVSGVGSGELEGPGAYSICADGAIVPDGGAGLGCQPAAHGWSLVQSCDAWSTCELDGERCYHCAEWSDRPGGL